MRKLSGRGGRFKLVFGALCITVISATLPASAHAVMITETWTARVSSGYTGNLSIGDTLSWSISYNNEQGEYHTWDDGADGNGEFGAGDDTDPTATTLLAFPTYIMFADILNPTFVHELAALIGTPPGEIPRDVYTRNGASRKTDVRGYIGMTASDDDVRFALWTDECCGGYLLQHTTNILQTTIVESTYRTNYDNAVCTSGCVPVPEPTTLLLLGTGLAGLAFTRRKGKRQ